MPRVVLRPTVPSDLPTVIGEPLPYRIRALTVTVDGAVVGVGGIAFPPGGMPVAFVQQAIDARKYPIAFHRAGLAAMAMIRESGLARVMASAKADDPRALRWLARLGFTRAPIAGEGGEALFIWSRTDAG